MELHDWNTLALGAAAGLLFALACMGLLLPGWLARSRRQGQADGEPQRERLAAELEAAQRELLAAEQRVARLEQQLERHEQGLLAAREEGAGLRARAAQLETRLEEQQAAAQGRLQELRDARERMKAEFQALAAELLDAKAQRLSEQSSQQLGLLLNPLREQIGDFRRMVGEVYEKENTTRAALASRIDELVQLNRTLGAEAQSLSRALSSDNRTQGYWGELKLERLLESAGLQKGSEYLTQESFRDSEGERYRPDAVLKLPEGRDIIIDAKVALLDYQRACEVEVGDRDQHLVRHVAAMRAHVKDLGGKDYGRLQGVQSPDLVLMFVPVEAAFLEALRRDPSLYDDAFRLGIVLVGPSNLLASLRLVAQIWRTDQQNRNARLIAERAGLLYDKFVGFVDDLDKIGDALDKAQKAQRAAVGKLAEGKGNLVRRVEQLRGLGVSPAKQLPAALLDLSDEAEGSDEEEARD